MTSVRRALAAAALLVLAGCGGAGTHSAALAATDPATGASTAAPTTVDPTTPAPTTAAPPTTTVVSPTGSSAPATTTPRPSQSSAAPTVRHTTPSNPCANPTAIHGDVCPWPTQPYPGPPRPPKLVSVTESSCTTSKTGYGMSAWFTFDALYAGWQFTFSDPGYLNVESRSMIGANNVAMPVVAVWASMMYPPPFPGSTPAPPPAPTSEVLAGTITFTNSAGSTTVPVSVTLPCHPSGH